MVRFFGGGQHRGCVVERTVVADVARIDELWNEFAVSLNAGDLERWLALWREDGIQLAPDTPRRVGIAQIRTGVESLLANFDTEVFVYLEEIRVSGDEAYTHGSHEFVMTPKEGGDVITCKGKFLTILRRALEGAWQIAIDCCNYDEPRERDRQLPW